MGLNANRAQARGGGARVRDGDAYWDDVAGSPLSSQAKVRRGAGGAIGFYETRAVAEEPTILFIVKCMLCYCRVLRHAKCFGSVITVSE